MIYPESNYLTITDVPKEHLSNGTASLLRVQSPQEDRTAVVRITDRGLLKGFDGKFIPNDWTVEGEYRE